MNFTKDFEEILVDFFKKYDQKNLNLVPDIMRRFRQDKRDVIMHLCSRYHVDINSIEGVEADMTKGAAERPKPTPVTETAGEAEGTDIQDENAIDEEAPIEKKSKKKLFIIIGIVVLLAALAGGYFMFMGGSEKPATTEEPAQVEAEQEAEPEPTPEPEPEPVPMVDSVAADTTKTDSTAADSASAPAEATDQEITE